MKLPQAQYLGRTKRIEQVKFGGINHTLGASDGELFATKNLTSKHLPVLASREKRGKVQTLSSPGGMMSLEKLAWVDGTKFYYDGVEKGTVTEGEKHFAALGKMVVIFPDKAYYNISSGEFASMENEWSGTATFSDGTLFGEEAEANTISGTGIGSGFRAGDAVSISGSTGNDKTIIVREVEENTLRFYENSFEVGATEQITVKRSVPELKFCCENENRLWGCDGTTIYASKPGDIFNFNVNDGLSSDSWTITTLSEGEFTGCISYRGYPIFFKENEIIKVYGSIPSNFELTSTATLGLSQGSGRSLAVAGETLFYLSPSGIVAYTGGIPQIVSQALGTTAFRNAAAGSDGMRYFVSMSDGTRYGMYVFDTLNGTWLQEDDTHATYFARAGGKLHFLNDAGEIWQTEGDNEPTVEWMAEFADIIEGSANKKGVSRMLLRLELDERSKAEVWLQVDSSGNWTRIATIAGETSKKTEVIPIVPRRCDHYRIRLNGTGGCRIYSLTRESYAGSDAKSRRV